LQGSGKIEAEAIYGIMPESADDDAMGADCEWLETNCLPVTLKEEFLQAVMLGKVMV